MRVKINISAGFTILNEVVTSNDLAKKELTNSTYDDTLFVVLTKAEERATDPSGLYQNVEITAIFIDQTVDTDNLPSDVKRTLVVMGTLPVVSRAFFQAAREVHDEKRAKIIKYSASNQDGFEPAFQEFRAAAIILQISETFPQILAEADPEKLGEPNPRNIGMYLTTVMNRVLSNPTGSLSRK